LTPPRDIKVAARIAEALGVWKEGMSSGDAAAATAEAIESLFASIGMPTRVRALEIPEPELPLLARDTLKNFNANPGARSEDYVGEMLRLLQAAW
jgi:alcohol dehydrogenase class IV